MLDQNQLALEKRSENLLVSSVHFLTVLIGKLKRAAGPVFIVLKFG